MGMESAERHDDSDSYATSTCITFYPFLLGLAGYIISNANRKVDILVKMSCNLILYDEWFSRYAN